MKSIASAERAGATRRLNLPAIEETLRRLQRTRPAGLEGFEEGHDPFDDEVVANLLDGYAFVDLILARGVEPFQLGNLRLLLDLNSIVLCGADPRVEQTYSKMLAVSEERFYEKLGGGIRNINEWLSMHQRDSPWGQAAGVYVRILAQPQLFVEGNHRTGALIVSYLLARGGCPPFVMTPENSSAYFEPSAEISATQKMGIVNLIRLSRLRKRFARFLKANVDERHLMP